MKMMYQNIRHAFIFEATAGFIALLGVFVYGSTGVLLAALLALRPLMLKRGETPPDGHMWHVCYDIFRVAVGITALSILVTFLLAEFGLLSPSHKEVLFVSVIPWYMITHGVVGYVISPDRTPKN